MIPTHVESSKSLLNSIVSSMLDEDEQESSEDVDTEVNYEVVPKIEVNMKKI
jgi:hypothetical protein